MRKLYSPPIKPVKIPINIATQIKVIGRDFVAKKEKDVSDHIITKDT